MGLDDYVRGDAGGAQYAGLGTADVDRDQNIKLAKDEGEKAPSSIRELYARYMAEAITGTVALSRDTAPGMAIDRRETALELALRLHGPGTGYQANYLVSEAKVIHAYLYGPETSGTP